MSQMSLVHHVFPVCSTMDPLPDKPHNVTQLISPPPEETLRRTPRRGPGSSKRKRRVRPSVSLQQEQTPNPKPRKQAKHLPPISESPTRPLLQVTDTNISQRLTYLPTDPFLANITLDVKPTRTRRSVTPIPHYDPPSTVFTSPREVIATPTISISSRRKSNQKIPSKLKSGPVKKELPDIDLSIPMPPPSPTDDPILLSGPSDPFRSSSRPPSCTFLPIPSPNDDLDSEDPAFFDWREHTRPVTTSDPLDSSSLLNIHPSDADVVPVDLPVFHLNDLPPSSDPWSDSDDDTLNHQLASLDAVEEGESEYTGRWRTLFIRTKQDPPSSITRARMEQWGRPISPFPEEAKSMQLLNDEGDIEEAHLHQVHQDVLEEEEVLRISLEPDEAPAIAANGEEHTFNTLIGTQITDSPGPDPGLKEATHAEGCLPIFAAGNAESIEGEHDESSGDEGGESFVTISSVDPHAAARAAAILKQYNYDCFTAISKSKRRQSGFHRAPRRVTDICEALTRKGVAEGRIEKQRPKRLSSVGTGVIGSQVFVSGVPVTTLGSLLNEAEAEVSFNFNSPQLPESTFESSFSTLLTSSRSLVPCWGERHWMKDDWKLLDSCFTDERVATGNENELADVEAIDLDKVVQRYIDLLGGEGVIGLYGNDWDKELIFRRVKALRRKQCAGKVAPPTSPSLLHPSSTGIPATLDINVPDFTPLKECVASKQAIQADGVSILHDMNMVPSPTTLGGYVKGFLNSYLPSLTKLKSPLRSKTIHPQPRHGLPLPPPELLEKSRRPINTPARPQLPKVKPPKELVQLHPAPLSASSKTSKIPRLAAPQRLVKLNPVPPPEPREVVSKFKPRRSSGSVKDLIYSFEEYGKANEEESRNSKKSRPSWRP